MIREITAVRKELTEHMAWYAAFVGSILLVAFGQPDRFFLFPLLSYLFGYGTIFYLCMKYKTSKRRFYGLFVWAFIVNLFQLAWLTVTYFDGLTVFIAYLILVCVFSFEFGCLALFLPKKGKLTLFRCFVIASVYTLFEMSRLVFPFSGFPFNNSGLVLTFHPLAMQGASIFGMFGLSFWTVAVGAVFCRVLMTKTRETTIMYSLLAVLPFLIGGALYFSVLSQKPFAKKYDVALVQTGLLPNEKWEMPDEDGFLTPLEQWQRILTYLDQSAKRHFDYIILPEGALPGAAYDIQYPLTDIVSALVIPKDAYPPLEGRAVLLEGEEEYFVSNVWILQALSNMYRSEIISGMIGFFEEEDISYNSAFHFVPFHSEPDRYDKQILVPMGEYLPFKSLLRSSEKSGITSFFEKGTETKIFKGKIPISVSVCFEEGYSYLVRRGRLKGSEMFVNVTNDGWFPKSRLPQEHMNVGIVRAVENGVPLLRACNTGITAIIDPLGRVLGKIDALDAKGDLRSGLLEARVEDFSIDTWYVRYGDNLLLFISLGILLTWLWGWVLRVIVNKKTEILPLPKKNELS